MKIKKGYNIELVSANKIIENRYEINASVLLTIDEFKDLASKGRFPTGIIYENKFLFFKKKEIINSDKCYTFVNRNYCSMALAVYSFKNNSVLLLGLKDYEDKKFKVYVNTKRYYE